MSCWSLIADHENKTYFQIGKWPIFGPGSPGFMVWTHPDVEGVILDLSDKAAIENELQRWNCQNIQEGADALMDFAKGSIPFLLCEEDDDYWEVQETYRMVGKLS